MSTTFPSGSTSNQVNWDASGKTASQHLTLIGGAGNDTFLMGYGMTSADSIDGGAGINTLSFTPNPVISSDGINGVANVQNILFPASVAINITTLESLVASGQTLTVNGSYIASSLTWNGSAETNGSFTLIGGLGNDTLIGGSCNDTFIMGSHLTILDTIKGSGGFKTRTFK